VGIVLKVDVGVGGGVSNVGVGANVRVGVGGGVSSVGVGANVRVGVGGVSKIGVGVGVGIPAWVIVLFGFLPEIVVQALRHTAPSNTKMLKMITISRLRRLNIQKSSHKIKDIVSIDIVV
jgi:hypothetical protein